MAAPGEDDDSSFNPSNDRLVDRYLRAKVDGKLSDLAKAAYFVDADVCSSRPADLVRRHSTPARVQRREAGEGQQFYFFSPARFVGGAAPPEKTRRSRTIDGTGGKESWHAEGKPKPIEGSVCGGYVTKFSYHVRVGPQAVVDKPGWIMAEYSFKEVREGDTVLCKVYRSPRGPGKSCKRKAADELQAATPPPSARRQRQTNEEEEDDAMLFARDSERELELVQEVHTEFAEMPRMEENQPELGETMLLHVEEIQPKPQIVPAGMRYDEVLQEWMMTWDEEEDTPQVPDGVDPDAYYMEYLLGDSNQQQQDAAV